MSSNPGIFQEGVGMGEAGSTQCQPQSSHYGTCFQNPISEPASSKNSGTLALWSNIVHTKPPLSQLEASKQQQRDLCRNL
eukprot:scaffold160549_cov18-Tisochrysis_lutea.AAC.1